MKLFYTLCLISFLYPAMAQEGPSINRTITVTGSAEMEVAPDEIELEIVISNAHMKVHSKENMRKSEDLFFKALAKNGIDTKEVKVSNSGYYWLYWWRYSRGDYRRKTFRVKLDASTDFMSLMRDLDIKEVESIRVTDRSNKQIQAYRKEVKIKAVQAAKEKATYLLESIDEKLGSIVTLEEVPESPSYYWRGNQNVLSNTVVSSSSNSAGIENITSIRVRYEMKAVFTIL